MQIATAIQKWEGNRIVFGTDTFREFRSDLNELMAERRLLRINYQQNKEEVHALSTVISHLALQVYIPPAPKVKAEAYVMTPMVKPPKPLSKKEEKEKLKKEAAERQPNLF